MIKLLNAVRHIERRPATDTKRGRPSRWQRKDLLRVAGQLRHILGREAKGRVSLNSFVGLYVRALDFPKDVVNALASGDVTLFEAAQLARLKGERLGMSAVEERERRRDMLRAHLLAQGSQAALRSRVNEQLGLKNANSSSAPSGGVVSAGIVDELTELDPYDTRHLFWEELKRIAFALRDITPEDVDDKTLDELLSLGDRLSSLLSRIQKRRRQRERARS